MTTIEEKLKGMRGGTATHEDCVMGYAEVLALLQEALADQRTQLIQGLIEKRKHMKTGDEFLNGMYSGYGNAIDDLKIEGKE